MEAPARTRSRVCVYVRAWGGVRRRFNPQPSDLLSRGRPTIYQCRLMRATDPFPPPPFPVSPLPRYTSSRSIISPRTRAIVVNTPHNPTGKVFSREELESIAQVVRENPRVSRTPSPSPQACEAKLLVMLWARSLRWIAKCGTNHCWGVLRKMHRGRLQYSAGIGRSIACSLARSAAPCMCEGLGYPDSLPRFASTTAPLWAFFSLLEDEVAVPDPASAPSVERSLLVTPALPARPLCRPRVRYSSSATKCTNTWYIQA